jgi:putative SOS response-associated peptidase YedK
MCNDYEQHVRWADYRKLMQALELTIPSRQSELDLPQADDIRISETGPVMRAAGNQIELVPMTFAFSPARPGGRDGTLPTATAASSLLRPSLSSQARSTPRRSTGSR